MAKSADDAITIIDQMALNDHQVQYNIIFLQTKVSIIKLGTNDAILTQNKLLTQIME